MAPSENVEVVRRLLAAVAGRDLDALLADCDPQCELTPMITAWPEPYRGHEGLRRWFADTDENWERFDFEIEEIRELDDETVMAAAHWRGRPRGAGADLEGPAAAVWRLREGKAIWAKIYPDEGRALEASEKSRP